ncbi:hypothetical protein M8J75_007365 [Diaphorina citri]|nr:hypothetical protein M8J75_007365 [Diaphorina citri]
MYLLIYLRVTTIISLAVLIIQAVVLKTKPNLAKKKLSDDKHFNKLISSYKSKINSAAASNQSSGKRWYDT